MAAHLPSEQSPVRPKTSDLEAKQRKFVKYFMAVLPLCIKHMEALLILLDHILYSWYGLYEYNLDPEAPNAPRAEILTRISILPDGNQFVVKLAEGLPSITVSRRLAQILALLSVGDDTLDTEEVIAFKPRSQIILDLSALEGAAPPISEGAFSESIRKLRAAIVMSGLPALVETSKKEGEPSYRFRLQPAFALSMKDVFQLFSGSHRLPQTCDGSSNS